MEPKGAPPFSGRAGDPASEADPLEPSESSVDSEASVTMGEAGCGADSVTEGERVRARVKRPDPKLDLEGLFARECGEGLRRGPNSRAHIPAGTTSLGLWVPLGEMLMPGGGLGEGEGVCVVGRLWWMLPPLGGTFKSEPSSMGREGNSRGMNTDECERGLE